MGFANRNGLVLNCCEPNNINGIKFGKIKCFGFHEIEIRFGKKILNIENIKEKLIFIRKRRKGYVGKLFIYST